MSLGRLNAPYGHRQVAPVEGKTANTPRLGPVSTLPWCTTRDLGQ